MIAGIMYIAAKYSKEEKLNEIFLFEFDQCMFENN